MPIHRKLVLELAGSGHQRCTLTFDKGPHPRMGWHQWGAIVCEIAVDVIYFEQILIPSLPNPAMYYATHSKILESKFSGNKSGMKEALRL